MEVLQITAIVIAILIILCLYIVSCVYLNVRCADQGKMEPINGWSLFAITLASIASYTGLGMLLGDGGIPTWPWPEQFSHSQGGNGFALLALGLIILLATYLTLIVKCSFWNGIAGIFLLTIAAISIVLIIIAIILLIILYLIATNQRNNESKY